MTEPLFAMYPGGVTTLDEPKLRELANQADAGQPFFATAVLAVYDMMLRHELKGVAPNQLFISIARKT